MNTSFHFASAQEITPTIEDTFLVPEWQIQEVRRRDAIMENNSDYLLNSEMVIEELERELETI